MRKPCHCKNLSSSKCFEWHLYNYEDNLCPNVQLNQTLFTGVIAHKNPKMGPNRSWTKKTRFFWLKSKTTNTQKLKRDIQKVYMDGPIIDYVRICDDPLTHGGNLDAIWAQKIFFPLILQEFCDFSGTWDLRY